MTETHSSFPTFFASEDFEESRRRRIALENLDMIHKAMEGTTEKEIDAALDAAWKELEKR